MAVALVGSVGSANSSGKPLTGAYGQSPTAGNLLVATFHGAAGSATNLTPSGASGWTHLLAAAAFNSTGGGGSYMTMTDAWYKVAAGGDGTPSFSVTGTPALLGLFIYELSGANTSTPLDTSGSYSSSGSGTSSTTVLFSMTTAASVAAAGEFGISAFTQNRTSSSSTSTWTESGTGWTNQGDITNGASTNLDRFRTNSQAGPASGSTLSDSGHYSNDTTAFGAGIVLVIKAAAGAAFIAAKPRVTGQAVKRASLW